MVQSSKTFTVNAINLKSYDLSDYDKIILMYSRESGLIRGVAKGCKKPKSKIGARADLLVANNILLSKGRNLDIICEAKTINSFKENRESIEKIMYSSYIAEIVSIFGVENDPCSEKIYDLLYKATEKISSSKTLKDILIAVMKFQLKIMQIEGFGIELNKCLCCGENIEEKNFYFSIQKGGVICSRCSEQSYGGVKIHHKIRDFLQSMLNSNFEDESEYDRKATEKVCSVCFELLKNYVKVHCNKNFKSVELLAETCNC